MKIPSEEEVLASVTDDVFRLRNWHKHRDDQRYSPGSHLFFDSFAEVDGGQFTRKHVFGHFRESTAKGVVSAIKWGFPRGGRPGGLWKPFSDAIRSPRYASAIETLRRAPSTATSTIKALNDIVPGVGTATTTKMAYFAGLCVQEPGQDSCQCLIYDQMVRRAVPLCDDPDFAELRSVITRYSRDLDREQQLATYSLYLSAAHKAALRRKVRPDQIELALFRLGRSQRSHAPTSPI